MRLTTIALALSFVLAVPACSDDGSSSDPGDVLNVRGKLTLTEPRTFKAVGSTLGVCGGREETGYGDIAEGTQVVVSDSAGKRVGVGSLGAGSFTAGDSSTNTCELPFSVADVPAGSGPYSISVGNRGEFAFNEADASALSLTIE